TFFILMCVSIITPTLFFKFNVLNFVSLLLFVVSNFLAQSQTGLVALFLYFVIYFSLFTSNIIVLITVFSIVFLLLLLGFIYRLEVLLFLSSKFDLYSINAMRRIVDSPENSGTLQLRIKQFISAFDGSIEKLGFVGAGWGREVFLESWPAYLVH